MEELFYFVTNVLFVTTLGWYLITLLQWYDYKIDRVVLKHHKWWWHIFYFIIPFMLYYSAYEFFWIFYYFATLPAFLLWNYKLDKRLVLTWRVKRFLILLVALNIFADLICTIKGVCQVYPVFLPIALAYIGSTLVEMYLFFMFKKMASKKLESMKNLKVIAVTGSFGKTSMKNFIYSMLKDCGKKVYMTPRSVNTLGGLVKDINVDFPSGIEYYVAEAGARARGDIYDIAQLIKPHIAVVGKVGEAHIEYFKSLDNIQKTKLELVSSPRLEKAFVYHNVTNEPHDKVTFFGENISDLNGTLDGLTFKVTSSKDTYNLKTSILGSFQAININAAILVLEEVGVEKECIEKAVSKLKSVDHRLQKIEAGGKIILDDGYNGNIDGMLEAIRLCSTHQGSKVIVTPGLVESSDELNIQLIESINDVFDLVIVTGKLNSDIFKKHLKVSNKIFLEDKTKLTDALATQTKSGDIILFANDAPSFI